ncbi:uncharacterized protein LOC116195974 [Punica granatum]|uniref:Uncharacterized protein LOC116195974 n=1 Tax=Punica granatum TaxID=22663 RepID=A0A218XA16_PUNGR|nr:uncharacterized protein LOC116195974 [Punica granatum]OWM81628.1 hypothetical protein CDL15_Pgr007666 [Punica granatum]
MGAEDENQQWKINVHAKSRSFSLRIRATGTPPVSSKRQDLSAVLRLRGFILKVKSASAPSHRHRHRGILKSMFRRFVERIRRPPPLAATAAVPVTSPSRLKQLARQEPVGIGFVFLAVFILGPVAGIGLRETIADGTFVPVTLALLSSASLSLPLIKSNVMGRSKNNTLLILSIVFFILGSAFLNVGKQWNFIESYVAGYLRKVWKFAL